jgi:hypothetical protein
LLGEGAILHPFYLGEKELLGKNRAFAAESEAFSLVSKALIGGTWPLMPLSNRVAVKHNRKSALSGTGNGEMD